MKETAQRNHYIDFLRGFAAVNIIFIHTCFWSGESYVPEWMQSVSLAVDVPFFFFLSGWSSVYVKSFQKSIRLLLGVYQKYIMFLPFLIAALCVTGIFAGTYPGLTLRTLYGNLFFLVPEKNSLPVVMGSMWFMPVYFSVLPLGQLLLSRIFDYDPGRKGACLFVVGIALLYAWWTGSFFLIPARILFYMFFYVLGAVCKNFSIHCCRTVILFGIADICIMKGIGIYMGWDISNMQGMKFPPNIIYLMYSLFGIIVLLWGKTKLQNISGENILCRIGRNAILFYFCQGIGSSLLFFVVPVMHMPWGVKLICMFAVNLFCTLVLVYLLKQFYSWEEKWIKKILAFYWTC